MDLKELKETEVWQLYQRGKSYLYMMNVYSDTDKNHRMYNGNQWEGLKIKSIEPVQLNFIKPVVKYKVAVINQNLWGIVYNPDNFEEDFRDTASQLCKLLNLKAANIWEKDRMDIKIRKISKEAAINDEAPMYLRYDNDKKMPISEKISKNDIYYGDENNSEIQTQPYILIRQRKSVIEARNLAASEGVPKEELEKIIGDNQTWEEAGDQAKYEVDDKVTIITKFYKNNGKVYYTMATRYLDIIKDENSGLTRYPIAHMLWEDKEGSARGEGEVRNLIANQIEVNKTLMRRALVAKQTAYPQKIVNVDAIENPSAVDTVGGTIKVKGKQVEDVKKMFATTQPMQMSSDVELLQNDLIKTTRELAGAGDITTGAVNPETASGKAILAVQNASQQPLVEQMASLKDFIEQIALIWLDMIITYNPNGLILQDKSINQITGEETITPIKVNEEALTKLKASVKIDITPISAYDKYAQELSMENLLKGGWFSPQKIGQLETYVEALPDNSTMPKQQLLELIKKVKAKQEYIAQIQAQMQMQTQRANQFLQNDPDAQASQMAEAQQRIDSQYNSN
jgi:hypothetical protein|uniref:Portal protein, Peptidoglycan hydrolase gp4, portal, tailspike, adhesin, VIRAL.5A n=1 Tax=Siphoviridae sp. ct1yA16 TaxID=2827767 RepID=A0A8S5TEQ7_9CAUD|nr:MAG TPA: Portal protein, Peptidoglycan hydrolase gp4, portal, tailspike, adhesin, VIRAL.5A [Siphoviridae sp. ct1yA16]